MNPDQKRQAANALKNNLLLSEVFAQCQQDLFEAWLSEDDDSARNDIWYEYRAINTFRRKLNVAIRNALGDDGQHRNTDD